MKIEQEALLEIQRKLGSSSWEQCRLEEITPEEWNMIQGYLFALDQRDPSNFPEDLKRRLCVLGKDVDSAAKIQNRMKRKFTELLRAIDAFDGEMLSSETVELMQELQFRAKYKLVEYPREVEAEMLKRGKTKMLLSLSSNLKSLTVLQIDIIKGVIEEALWKTPTNEKMLELLEQHFSVTRKPEFLS